jgi:outer membrane cobalamin receptor
MQITCGLRGVLTAVALVISGAGQLVAQAGAPATVTGRVTAEDGRALAGVQVVVSQPGTARQFGALTTDDGRYSVAGLRPGLYRIVARTIGYDPGTEDGVRLGAGESREINFTLGVRVISLDAIEVFATRAIERVTPVAYTDVDKPTMEQQLGSQDIPLVLNTKPSVYSTEQGGAAGDARINVRGFDQRNVSVMINGVPVNDMENGWVYWSNWDGVGDATSSIQLQRGLSAVNLATPSIGGTMNIITDPTAQSAGGMLKQEYGSDGFLKTTAMLASGLLADKFAFMAQGVRKTGNGLAEGIWTDAWAYYFGASYKISNSNRLDLYALGAPQRHGQRSYAQNIGAFSAAYALRLDDYDPAAMIVYDVSPDGLRFNQNWNSISESYTGQQAEGSKRLDRHEKGFLNERENFFHKPQVNLNWYSSLSETVTLTTVGYYSGGSGGGTGTYGDFLWDYDSQPTRIADWDGNIAINLGTEDRRGDPKVAGEARGILRNSRNDQWSFGAISKLAKQFSPAFTMEIGGDWRTAEIDHYREVRDLLGADYILDTSSDFWSAAEQRRGLGDKIGYDFTNTVDWLGGYLQGEYVTPQFTVYGMGGLSTIKYTYRNHFLDDGTGNPLYAETDYIYGFQFKGGGLYNLTPELGVYANGGYVSRVPIFDGVIDDYAGAINPDPQNEKFLAFEGGLNYRTLDRSVAINLNGYYTRWDDRTVTRGFVTETGEDALISLLGLDALHTGVEAEVALQPSYLVRFDVGASLSNWVHTDDVTGTYRPDARDQATETYNFYVKDLKVGNAPQTQVSAAVSLFPIDGLSIQAIGKRFSRFWAAFDPIDRTDETDRAQSWRMPGYTVFDGHFSYTLPESLRLGQRLMVFGHVFNLLDAEYVMDALDNSPYNGFDGDHDADDAEVFFGLQRRFNVGLQLNF